MKISLGIKGELPAEDGLVLLCGRLNLSPDHLVELDKILTSKNLSWKKVLRKAEWQYLAAFLFHHLQQPEFRQSVPPWVMDELKRVYFRNGLRNRLLQTELQKTLEMLRKERIPVIALKGAALLETVYPNNLLRPMADIDLLVPEGVADAAHARVCELGYIPAGSEDEQEKTRAVHHHLPKLVDPQGLVKFEIHTHIVPRDSPFRFDISSFWQRSRLHSIAGVGIRVPAPEHMLIHLAVHFFLDRRFRTTAALRQLCDIAETARHYQPEIDWESMAKEVSDYGLSGPVHCGLFLAQELLDAPIPLEFLKRIAPEEFNTESMDLLVKRRILGGQRVIASGLVKPTASYTPRNVVVGVLSRIYPQRAYLASRYGGPSIHATPTRLRLLRLLDGLGLLAQYVSQPLAIRQEVLVDRWIHAVSSSPHRKSLPSDNHQGAL